MYADKSNAFKVLSLVEERFKLPISIPKIFVNEIEKKCIFRVSYVY